MAESVCWQRWSKFILQSEEFDVGIKNLIRASSSSPPRPLDQKMEQGNIAELSPGAVGAGGAGGGAGGGSGGRGGGGYAKAEHQAAINSMMMERMSTDIYALKKQYTRIKRRQQQQAMQLYIRTGGGGDNILIILTLSIVTRQF